MAVGINRLEVSTTVRAEPAQVFALVTDPGMHVVIDGSGMLVAAPGTGRRVTAVGDTFGMDMDREPLGDRPMGKYNVLNTVTRISPDTVFEWNVGSAEQGPFGHVYGWEVTPLGDGQVKVTNYCDWSGIPDRFKEHFPIVPEHMMQRSLENLVRLLDEPAR